MPSFPTRRVGGLLAAALTVLPAALLAQSIQRCESADGRISYSDAACPPGTRAARAVAPATQPSAATQQEARERLQRDRATAKALEARHQPAPATTAARGPTYVSIEEAQRAADCAYLRAELDSNRRLRNVLTTRTYYSTEDVEQMDAREEKLAADYRRFCSR